MKKVKKIRTMLQCAVMGISLVGCNVSTGGGGTKGETQMAESTEAGVEQEQQSTETEDGTDGGTTVAETDTTEITETATEEPSEATKNPENGGMPEIARIEMSEQT